jgi:hypothetical protein
MQAAQLRAWYDSGGAAQPAAALSRAGGGARADRRVALAQVAAEGVGKAGKAEWVQALVYVAYIRSESPSYPACPLPRNGRACAKKLVDQDGGGAAWFCETCGAPAQVGVGVGWRWAVGVLVCRVGRGFRACARGRLSFYTPQYWRLSARVLNLKN